MKKVKIDKISRASLAEKAADKLRNLILRQTLPPGSTVTERDLSEKLGISRTPLREAIRLLANEGLLIVSDTGRTSVADPDIETICELLTVLGALEGLAGELAAKNASESLLQKIEGFHLQMKDLAESDDHLAYFNLNIKFHRSIVDAANNRTLSQAHKTIDDQLYRMRYESSQTKQNRHDAINEHGEIVEALMARKPATVRKLMIHHLQTTEKILRQRYEQNNADDGGR